MTLLIVEYVSWIAFVGAGLLVGWVGADMLISKRRKPRKPAPEPADSGRGLVGPAEPMSSARQASVGDRETETEEPRVEAPAQPEIEPAEELVLPVSQAVEMTEEAEEAEEAAALEPEEPADLATDEADGQSEDEALVSGDVMLVKRDPSVRVFDAVVAPSERKVLTED
ncbi:MAG: hypothetical protein KDB82_18765 [Planctomycetes bacterium]|nr:hypothetical protein [Planctomycetota bacterium]